MLEVNSMNKKTTEFHHINLISSNLTQYTWTIFCVWKCVFSEHKQHTV